LQLLEMGIPCLVAVNMLDIAEKQHIAVDCEALAKKLGCPVIPLISTRGVGIEKLKTALVKPLTQPAPKIRSNFPVVIETAIAQLLSAMAGSILSVKSSYHYWLAIRLL